MEGWNTEMMIKLHMRNNYIDQLLERTTPKLLAGTSFDWHQESAVCRVSGSPPTLVQVCVRYDSLLKPWKSPINYINSVYVVNNITNYRFLIACGNNQTEISPAWQLLGPQLIWLLLLDSPNMPISRNGCCKMLAWSLYISPPACLRLTLLL